MNPELITIRAGDSAQWLRAVPLWPAGAGWSLVYRLLPREGGAPITINTTAEGDAYRVALTPADTATWAPGEYTLVGAVERGDGATAERITVHTSALTVQPDLMAAAAIDGRSPARKIVEAIDAWLSGRTGWAGEKSVGDRRIKDHTMPDLLRLRDYYATQARADEMAERLANGMGGSPRVMVRM